VNGLLKEHELVILRAASAILDELSSKAVVGEITVEHGNTARMMHAGRIGGSARVSSSAILTVLSIAELYDSTYHAVPEPEHELAEEPAE
jgi:hypothetical protein